MGQQQLLLIILAVIIVGVAIVMGITVFTASSAEHKRDLLVNECLSLASIAQKYYRVPRALGGGNRSFSGWDIPEQLKNSSNGNFSAISTANNVIITAVGTEILANGDSIGVKIRVLPNNTEIIELK